MRDKRPKTLIRMQYESLPEETQTQDLEFQKDFLCDFYVIQNLSSKI